MIRANKYINITGIYILTNSQNLVRGKKSAPKKRREKNHPGERR